MLPKLRDLAASTLDRARDAAAPAPVRSLLVYREEDRQRFKYQYPLLTPDVPVHILPVEQKDPGRPSAPVACAPQTKAAAGATGALSRTR